MDFKEKLKKRLYLGIAYIVIGVIMIICYNLLDNVNTFISSFGFALIMCGIVRVRNYFIITKSEERIRRQQIAETDERNIAISNKAKSWAFGIYLMGACILVIALQFTNLDYLSTVIAFSICALVLLYWISYHIIKRKC